ncbi:unnamed protein product, partial [Porites lobata]
EIIQRSTYLISDVGAAQNVQGSIGNFFYVNFMISEFSYLNITRIGWNLTQHENDCGYACLEIPTCFSYNVAAFPDVNGKLLCELLPSDKFNNWHKFNASKAFHHFYIPILLSVILFESLRLWKVRICFLSALGFTCIFSMPSFPSLWKVIFRIAVSFHLTSMNKDSVFAVYFVTSPCPGNAMCVLYSGFDFSRKCSHRQGHHELAYVISSVVTRFLSPAIGNNSNWALCWQASTHGWAASTFHNKCDGKRHMITIIKKDQYVFGGYTNIPWSK